jgi:hypothetical protein
MDEVLARERLERVVRLEPELLGGCAHLHAAWAADACETPQDPGVELALRLREPGTARRLARVGVLGVDVHFPASVNASRTQFSSGCSLARVMGTSVRMIERHYGALLDGAHNVIASRLDAIEAELEQATGKPRGL